MSAVSAGMVAERRRADRSRGRPGQRRGRFRASGVAPLHERYKEPSDRRAAERERLLGPLLRDLDALAGEALAVLRRDLPAYADRGEPFHQEVLDQLRRNYSVLLSALIEARLPRDEELGFQRGASMRRARAGVALEDYLSAYRVAQQVLWDAIVAHAERTGTDQKLVLELAAELMRDMDFATTHAGRTYAEYREHASAVDEERRDLLEQMLRGALPTDGPLAAAADRCGIGASTSTLVAVAVPLAAGSDRDGAELASATFAGVGLHEPCALVVVRRHQLVAVLSLTGQPDPERLCVRLDQAHERLRSEGAPMAIGVSAIARGIGELSAAHDEAVSAVRFVGKAGGVFALTRVSLMDYLALSGGATARRLIEPRIVTFLADDARRGGMLVATLGTFAAANLSLKHAAARLHVHPNTLNYRLQRVEYATGLNPRRFEDLRALLVAVEVNEPNRGGCGGAARPDAG
jgi:PucR-like helix-turn-helix protein/diguanylate cyclase with GGDEF domain